jgi:hypothetical protein
MTTPSDAPGGPPRPPRPVPTDGIQARPGSLPPRTAVSASIQPTDLTDADPIVADNGADDLGIPFPDSPLVDRDVFEQVRFPYFSVAALVVALASCWFLLGEAWPATAIIAPMCLAIAVVCSYDWFRPRRLRISVDGLECSRPRRFVPFNDLRSIVPETGRKGRSGFPVAVIFRTGSISIPARLTCDAEEFVRLLRSRLRRASELPPTPPIFDVFLKQQSMLYPIEMIHVFRGSSRPMRPTATRVYFKLAVILLAPLPLWIGLANAFPRKYEPFLVVGALCGIFGLVFVLGAAGSALGGLAGSARVKNADDAVLIITPGGIALTQADLRGELRWGEVQKVFKSGVNTFQWTAQAKGLALRVHGADVVIADIYDWPIDAIHTLIGRYWRR